MARTVKTLGIALIFCMLTSVGYSAEVIKAEPIFSSAPVIKPHIVEPPSKPVQTLTPSVNYVPKMNQTINAPIVKNATLNISAPKTTPAVNYTTTSVRPTPVATQQVSQTTPQMISFQNCTKIFPMEAEKLFYLAVASISANKFAIDEMQTKSGYVLFSVVKKQFLLSVATVDKKNSIIKITPANNNYYFPAGIVNNIFKYIDLNVNSEITKI